MTQFAEYPEPLDYSVEYFLKAVSGPIGHINASATWTEEGLDWGTKLDLTRPRTLLPNSDGHLWLRPGRAQGEIIGGCLYTIHQLRGTGYLPGFQGKILFFETPEGEAPFKGQPLSFVKSQLMDLQLSGVFEGIKGLVVGRPYGYSQDERAFFNEMVSGLVADSSYPVLLNVNIGHTDPMVTVPLGVRASMDSSCNLFSIDESGVTTVP